MTLLDLLFPRRCVSCGRIGRYFCKNCSPKIEFVTHAICPVCTKPAIDGATHPRCQTRYSLDGLTCFFHYEEVIRRAVKLLKYQFVSDLAKEFIDLIPLSSIQPTIQQFNNAAILVPVPLHPTRLRFRGFNQAEVLGGVLAKRLNILMRLDILKRIRKTTPQVEVKDREKRLKSMKGVFAVNQSKFNQLSINNQQLSIFLFDDVFTTGATLRSAGNVLKRAGVRKVWGVALAHG